MLIFLKNKRKNRSVPHVERRPLQWLVPCAATLLTTRRTEDYHLVTFYCKTNCFVFLSSGEGTNGIHDSESGYRFRGHPITQFAVRTCFQMEI